MRYARKVAPYLAGLLAMGLLGVVVASGVLAENEPAPAPAPVDATTGLLSREAVVANALANTRQDLAPQALAAGVVPQVTSAVLTTNGKLAGSKEDAADSVPIWVVKVKALVTAPVGRPDPEDPEGGSTQAVYEGVEWHIDARPDGHGVLGVKYGPSQ